MLLHHNHQKTQTHIGEPKEVRTTSVERDVTIASSLKAEQASGNINKTQFTATLNEPSFLELGLGGHTLRSGEDIMEHQIELTDNVPNTPHDSPLPGVNTPGSDEGSLELNELMDLTGFLI
ncbi:hypothetical protein Tco_0960416 [Tanacetum coccineum]